MGGGGGGGIIGSIFALTVTLEGPHSLFLFFFFSIRIYFKGILKLKFVKF